MGQTKRTARVYADTVAEGNGFALRGVLRRVGTGRVVARAENVRPFGFTASALADAEWLADDRIARGSTLWLLELDRVRS